MLRSFASFLLLALASLARQSLQSSVSYSSSSSSSSSSSWSQGSGPEGQPSSFSQRTQTASHCVNGVCNQAMSHRNSDPKRTHVPSFDALSTDPHRLFQEPRGWISRWRDEENPFGPSTSMRRRLNSMTWMRDRPSIFGDTSWPFQDPFATSFGRLKRPVLRKRESLGNEGGGADDDSLFQPRPPPRLGRSGVEGVKGSWKQQNLHADGKFNDENAKHEKSPQVDALRKYPLYYEQPNDRKTTEGTPIRTDASSGMSKPPSRSSRRREPKAILPPTEPKPIKQQKNVR